MYKYVKALCDLRESINSISFAMFQKLGFGAPNTNTIRLLMVDHSIKKLVGMLYDVLVKVY